MPLSLSKIITSKTRSKRNFLDTLLLVLIVLGIVFRFTNLDQKVYWHDEVYTTIRSAGFTRQEIDQTLFQNRFTTPSELQKFQQLKPGSTAIDTINSLATEDPQHPPLYFLIARFWMQIFGSSLTASRILPVLFSLLSLPLIYILSLELFSSKLTAIFSTVILSLSPFDLLFAQTARQYSLLTLWVIASSLLLLRALRLKKGKHWYFYTLACTAGLYTHPFFVLTIIAQGTFVTIDSLLIRKKWGKILLFLWAIAISSILYSPWLLVLKNNYQRMLDTTSWANSRVDLIYLVKLWILSFISPFFDLGFGVDNIWTYLIRVPFILLIFISVYTIYRQASYSSFLFILTSAIIPFLLLSLPDLILGGKRSAVTRYLIFCFPGIQLAVAYFISQKLLTWKKTGKILLISLLTSSILTCTVITFSNTWWHKDLSYFNADIARNINSASSPLVISDRGDDWTNMGDLIALSYFLKKDVQLLLLNYPPNVEKLQDIISKNKSEIFIFRPSNKLLLAFEQSKKRLNFFFPGARLWKLESPNY